MNRLLRIGLALALLVGTGALLFGLQQWSAPSGEQPSNVPTQQVAFTNQDCQQCHAQVWQEWESSGHAQAFTADAVQAAFRHFGHDRKCESCHAPQPVLLTGLEEPVELRADDRESGVNCLSCHSLPEGQVAAARTILTLPADPNNLPSYSPARLVAAVIRLSMRTGLAAVTSNRVRPAAPAICRPWKMSHHVSATSV